MLEDEGDCIREFRGLCTSLNLDKLAAEESWENYLAVKRNITLEGDQRHWLGCAVYAACRKARPQTVGRPSIAIDGNFVSLAGLLRQCDLTVIEFFKKCKKWIEWSELPNKYRARLEHLERKFTVSMVIFLKYRPIFIDMFKEPVDSPQHKSKKPRNLGCSGAKLFEFSWILFLCLKARVPDVAEDLVNSFHLLLATCDLIFGNVLLEDRRELLNPEFPGFPSDFNSKDYKIPTTAPCIIDLLCRRHGAISVEASFAKTYCLRPQIASILREGIISGIKHGEETVIIHPSVFESNLCSLEKCYAEYVISVGDFDERIFLSEDATDDIGASAKPPEPAQMTIKRDADVQMTPLSGRELLKDKESPSKKGQTTISAVTQSVRHLISMISGRSAQPSAALLERFRACHMDLEKEIEARVTSMGKKFMEVCQIGQVPGRESSVFFERRLDTATTLYYRLLENVLARERTTDIRSILQTDIIHQSMFACALEIVLFSYDARRPFPWILDALEIEPYYFYKVIEIIIRAENLLSRAMIKHLNMIDERVLESLAWRSHSPLWDEIANSLQSVPRCDEVSLPNQLLSETEMAQNNSEPPNPATRPQLADRFASPISRVVRPGQSLLNANYQQSGNASLAPNIVYQRNDIPNQQRSNAPLRTGSLALFFRKFYFLSNLRMQDLCTRLEIVDVSLKRKIWTCFEHSIVHNTELMKDRHLDQILMCAVYVMCRVLHTVEQPTSTQFTDILRVYRNQPQAESSVYRNVLLKRNTGTEQNEERGNLIQFYNKVYMKTIQAHAREYATVTNENNETHNHTLTLSPLPRIHQQAASPRKLNGRIFINQMELCPSFDDIDGTAISIHDSPAKDLEAINQNIRVSILSNRAVKRILDDSDVAPPSKQSRTIFMKLNSVMNDRCNQ